MLQISTPPPTNVDVAATAAAATANASAITTSPGSMPVAVIGLKLIGVMIPNVAAGNLGGSGTTQKATNANTQKGLRHFSQLNPSLQHKRPRMQKNKKGSGVSASSTPS
jgi:hypothetical protein